MRAVIVLVLVSSVWLTGCETTHGPRTKTLLGGAGGAAAGGLLAATFGGSATGIAAGTILGGLIGGAIGDRLDAADRRTVHRTTTHVLETQRAGSPVPWRNPESGNYGQVVATRTYQASTGQYCREYQQSVVIGGREEHAYGTACRQPDGSWEVQN